jgi:hypothetical protein
MTTGHEQDIATYLTLDGHVFLAPQYNIPFDRELNEGGTCPDFVALDLKTQEVVVVEVTTASNVNPLFSRIEKRSTCWYGPIRRRLEELRIAKGWQLRFLGFVRRASIPAARASFTSAHDVAFCAIEDATFIWDYWDKRIRDGLPR